MADSTDSLGIQLSTCLHVHVDNPHDDQRCFYLFLSSGYELTGLSRGGQQVGKCQEVYAKAVKLLVELASLQVKDYSLLIYKVSFLCNLYLLNNLICNFQSSLLRRRSLACHAIFLPHECLLKQMGC